MCVWEGEREQIVPTDCVPFSKSLLCLRWFRFGSRTEWIWWRQDQSLSFWQTSSSINLPALYVTILAILAQHNAKRKVKLRQKSLFLWCRLSFMRMRSRQPLYRPTLSTNQRRSFRNTRKLWRISATNQVLSLSDTHTVLQNINKSTLTCSWHEMSSSDSSVLQWDVRHILIIDV